MPVYIMKPTFPIALIAKPSQASSPQLSQERPIAAPLVPIHPLFHHYSYHQGGSSQGVKSN